MRRLVVAILPLAAGLALAPPAEAALRFKRCELRLQVRAPERALDRSGAVPGRVSLFVEARRAAGAAAPPVRRSFVLAGGPGQSATASGSLSAAQSLGVLYPAYRNRDLVIFDQRGTGRSGLLRCRLLEHANLLERRGCRGRLRAPARAAQGLLHEP